MADTPTSTMIPERPQLPPFPFNKSVGDIVLRTSDNVDFRVRSAILAEASPVFEDMFSLPQPTAARSDDPISLSEDSRTLEVLLRICYPIVDPIPPTINLDEVDAALQAAVKYDIHAAEVLLKRSLVKLTPTDPIHAYCIACRVNLEPEARGAAEEAVKQNVVHQWTNPKLQGISAGCYYRLMSYKRKAQKKRHTFTFCTPQLKQQASKEPADSKDSDDNAQPAAPFPFNCADADVTLVSSDHVEFRVYSKIICLASPVLSEMIKCSQSSHDFNETTGVSLEVPESSKMLESLLKLIYPCTNFDLDTMDDLIVLAPLAHKYKMDKAMHIIRSRCLAFNIGFAPYFLASQYGWDSEVQEALKLVLFYSSTKLETLYTPVMEDVPASIYLRLLDYHKRCTVQASRFASAILADGLGVQCEVEDGDQDLMQTKGGQPSSDASWISIKQLAVTAMESRPYVDDIAPKSIVFSQLLQFATSCRAGCKNCTKRKETAVMQWERMRTGVSNALSAVKLQPTL